MAHSNVVSDDPTGGSEPASRWSGRDDAARGRLASAVARLAVGFLALVVCLLLLGSVAEDVRDQEANALDAVANPFLHHLASPALDVLLSAATFMGSAPTIPILLLVALAMLLYAKRRREAVFVVLAIGGSFALNEALKLVFHRPRPQLAWAHVQPEYSFPSGHAQNGLVFYLAIALVVWLLSGRRAGIAAVVGAVALAVLIGLSRIYFGYHYVTDVVAGYFAGLSWLLVVGAALDAGPLLREWRNRNDVAADVRDAVQGSSAAGPGAAGTG